MKKKLGLLLLAAVLLVTSTVTGTLAQQVDGAVPLAVSNSAVDTAEPEDLIENIVDDGTRGYLPWITNAEALYPGTTLKKNFCVRNEGTEAVNVRTWFAFEADSTNFANLIALEQGADWTWTQQGQFIREGVRYDLWLATYNNALAAGETTSVSLGSVSMNPGADNPQVVQFDDEYEIMIVSQAVEAASNMSLDYAFGTDHPFDH